MKRKRLTVGALIVSITMMAATGVGAVTGASPGSANAFRYDGQLARPNGTYDFRFQLFDHLTGGAQVGSTLVVGDVPVAATRYTVALDFGAGALPGAARWLQVAWRGGSSTGSYSTLSPRQELLAAPYALGVRLPLSEAVQSTGPAFSITNAGTSGGSAAIHGQAANGYGVYGNSSAGAAGVYGTGTASGVIGEVNSSLGSGVVGDNNGSGHGVTGVSAHGIGVDASGATYGVLAGTGSPSGVGVYGKNSGGGDGVQGVTGGAGASGVFGNNTGGGKGVFGASTTGNGVEGGSTGGNGVQGESTRGNGVQGESTRGNGVQGESTRGNGVQGVSASGTASGVYGQNNGGGYGVAGRSPNGVGVLGDSANGFAMQAAGNTTQSRASGGWVKAMALVTVNGTIGRCYNSQATGATVSSGGCGFSVNHDGLGDYIVDFSFRVSDRFVMVTPLFSGGTIGAELDTYSDTAWDVSTFYSSNHDVANFAQFTDAPFFVFVF